MNARAVWLQTPTRPARWAAAGAAAAGLIGAIAGLLLGLVSYPPTAWFAVIELGLPGAAAGGLAGLVAGVIATALRRIDLRARSR